MVVKFTWRKQQILHRYSKCSQLGGLVCEMATIRERELPSNGGRQWTLVIRLKWALWGASGSHTLIRSRHLIDTLCKVLCRWTKRTGLFYSPVNLADHHLPAGCVSVSAFTRTCVCFVRLSVCSSFCISSLLILFKQLSWSVICSDHCPDKSPAQ